MTLMLDEHGLFRETDSESARDGDVLIKLPAQTIGGLLLDRKNLFSSLRLSGPADVAESLGFVFRNLRWDAEGDLASLLGDIPAHRLSLATRSVATQAGLGLKKLGANISEYVVEDSGMLPNPGEMLAFKNSLVELQTDLERLEKRLAGLNG